MFAIGIYDCAGVEAEVVIVQLTTFSLHVIDGGEVAKSAVLRHMTKHVINVGTVVANRLTTAVPLTDELLCLWLLVPRRHARGCFLHLWH